MTREPGDLPSLAKAAMSAAVTEVDAMIRTAAPAVPHTDAPAQTRLLVAAFALSLGAFLVWGAGFASADALHDTVHDARHAMGLPCH
ncbi:CbtB-domain containing protein [Aureimonas sp. AU20]|uniref:CbtB domain-containing protein n=2 Tax=Aureimonas sp. AU20 TaxID=1349819 RepID=UPI0007216FAA|nr:CbtB-domain containing protein [Aureimonas sp. AU20]ALN71767.1 hypothetical protein M673_03520 [Aureimonas sp. AU20]